MMSIDFVHLHPNRLNHDRNLFLLLIPAVVFAIVLGLVLSQQKEREVASIEAPAVLGEESP